ncbi:hypothetical protein ACPPVU_09225 [Mucilaginibacter sp. McL0603]|uniref:hypothetical protein n=1 Tax=Mucilaginibacter sp. McL0603 TaxID=3415670 RepID=UPI003CEAEDEC
MGLRYLLGIVFLLSLSSCKGQLPPKQYNDALVVNNEIWGLTTDGKIRTFNLNDGSPLIKETNDLHSIVAFAKDNKSNIVIANSSDRIQIIDQKSFKRKTIGRCDSTVYAITFDHQNNCYALTAKGVVDIGTGRSYVSTTSINKSIKYQPGLMVKPDAFFIDTNDNIWIGFGHGEWGGNLFVFNTRTKKYIKLDTCFKNGISPVKSIFEGDDNIYISTGLQHMLLSGSIIKVNNFKSMLIFDGSEYFDTPDGKSQKNPNPQYIGPATFNKQENCIYFYSHQGIFRGNIKDDLSKIENWEKIIKPKLHWTNGQSNAVGSPMNVTKIQVMDRNKFFFVSKNDGIGLYTSGNLIMLQ